MSAIMTNFFLKNTNYFLYYLYFKQMGMQNFFSVLYGFEYSLDFVFDLFDIKSNFTNYYFEVSSM